MKEFFKPSELLLSYSEFKELSDVPCSSDLQEWLNAWNAWDFACSPLNDSERKQIRYGYYLGWWAHKNR